MNYVTILVIAVIFFLLVMLFVWNRLMRPKNSEEIHAISKAKWEKKLDKENELEIIERRKEGFKI